MKDGNLPSVVIFVVKVQIISLHPYPPESESIEKRIFATSSRDEFNALALEIFRFQVEHSPVYRFFCELLDVKPQEVTEIDKIPFLPIELFKNHRILSGNATPEISFSSSGTTGSIPSMHHVLKKSLYEKSFLDGFLKFYGVPNEYRILALLPNYLERSGSSLVYMVDRLIKESGSDDSGFFLNDRAALRQKLLTPTDKKTLLIGVSFALLDLVTEGSLNLENTIVMETGGMKGRRKELTRPELHSELKAGLGVEAIHSEYGMTELLSQAYSKADGLFECPEWMQLRIRDLNDPLSRSESGKTGGINVIDLANLYSCSFIATSDLGRENRDGKVEILGRFDYSDMRGCNLMV